MCTVGTDERVLKNLEKKTHATFPSNRRVPADVFVNTKLEDFLDCSEVPRMSLAPWTGKVSILHFYLVPA